MPRAPRIDFADALYHVIARGNGREDIFWADDDRHRFLGQRADGVRSAGVLLDAYVLMDSGSGRFHRAPVAQLTKEATATRQSQ